jgi:hypothetical protein
LRAIVFLKSVQKLNASSRRWFNNWWKKINYIKIKSSH